ncbi:hypothetical protein F5B20DRAFT_594864 [Whalleya microplaca]|nr:hypothetical protein F5B20DRAFT_594864 [Whalleya microplaca]
MLYHTILSFAASALFMTAVSTSALSESQHSNLEARVACDPIEKYSTSWFLANTCKRPKASSCLFYTRGLSKRARIFSKSGGHDMTTIWEMWDKSQYDKRQVTTNKMRCIMQDKTKRQTYFEHMSESMAIMCDVFATVMDPDPHHVRMDGIWGRVEFPTLKKTGNQGTVNQIEATNADGTQLVNVWSRPHKRSPDMSEPNDTNVNTRATCGIDGNDPSGDFDVGGDYPVDW